MNILITGGTGSIGQALAERLINLSWTRKVCIYSRDEHKQEAMAKRLGYSDKSKLRFFIGDVRNRDRLELALRDIHIVIHAAALKIVPVAEYNPFECVNTNIHGTQNVINAVLDTFKSKHITYTKVLLLSTDKAVRPINLYGATKLCAEKLITSSNNIMGPGGPIFSVARYGNIANSNGSVIKVFQDQVSRNEQLTITDDRMTRFWITIDQAVDFIIKCLDRMHGGEIFVPEMPRFYVKDLALTMMKNYPMEKQYNRVVGIRQGEKIHEEIITPEEFTNCDYDPNTNTYIINPPPTDYTLREIDQIIKQSGIASNSEFVKWLNPDRLYEELKKLGVIQ